MGRLAETTAAIAGRLDDALAVSYESDAFDEAQAAKQSPSPSPSARRRPLRH